MSERLYQIALTRVPHIGHVHARTLIERFGSASEVFAANRSLLEKTAGIGSARASHIKSFNNFKEAETEIRFIEQHGIQPLFITDAAYPQRLLHCYDAPVLLFYKGQADLNAPKIIAIVGTRLPSDYGKQVTDMLIKAFNGLQVTIVSGLAYGIDAIAHKSAISNHVPTIGVLGHGLDQVYPPAHNGLAREMLQSGGGLLTEFCSNTPPDKHHFPGRNRIVAGISDAVVLVETGIKGGSMITADIADSYHRDVFAVPGRITDRKSEGCNYLIKNNKAILLTEAAAFMEAMGWQQTPVLHKQTQHELFIQLDEDERKLAELLQHKETVSIDELNLQSGLSNSRVAASVLGLELKGILRALPGKRYRIVL